MNHKEIALIITLAATPAVAGQVQILGAEFLQKKENKWTVAVTLKHDDSGWDHYADAWRIVDVGGEVLGLRSLLHPHEDEQPFTRDLDGIYIVPETTIVYVEAHDKVHGWGAQRLRVDLKKAQGEGYRVIRK